MFFHADLFYIIFELSRMAITQITLNAIIRQFITANGLFAHFIETRKGLKT